MHKLYPGMNQVAQASSSMPEYSSSPISSVSTSLSTSLSSSMASEALPSNSSQPNLQTPDHAASNRAPNTQPPRLHELSQPHATRGPSPSSTSFMGHNPSKPAQSAPPPASSSTSAKLAFTAAATGIKLKRAFAGRRKNSSVDTSAASTDTDDGEPQRLVPTQRTPKLSLQLAAQAFSKRTGRTPLSATPPPLPPKPSNMKAPRKVVPPLRTPPPQLEPVQILQADEPLVKVNDHRRSSIIPLTAGISSAVDFMRAEEERTAQLAARRVSADAADDIKEAWRRSDSTTYTVRMASGNIGTRTPRPLSTAESLQSNHTIVPPSRRMSTALDADVPEEKENDYSYSLNDHISRTEGNDFAAKALHLKRRSWSLNAVAPEAYPYDQNHDMTTRSFSDHHPHIQPSARETPTLSREAAQGIIAPSTSGLLSTGHQIRGKLAAWTATNSQARSPLTTPGTARSTTGLRQTAVSMSNGIAAPAAGLARRAVEKMGRWGFSGGSSSGYSSSSSSTAPSSYSENALTRTSSNQSDGKHNKMRRTPDAPSGAWSMNSSLGSASLSDFDGPSPSEAHLGLRLRGTLTRSKGPGTGIVFGRELESVVKLTAVGVGPQEKTAAQEPKQELMRELEMRKLPALMVRCAQHLMFWGMQEEGLFRLSGRPAHVSKLRTEFDSGADYDMLECSPGELDPHAVASVFKAFLREMPEPILSRSLQPYFDEVLAREGTVQSAQSANASSVRLGGRGPGLPSGPKAGIGMAALRKPPSLSTLALPNFNGIPSPSINLVNALKALVSQLPDCNRDLLRTVTELIMATAKESRQTKMPLSNLLLVFCPSLNMNPPLLRILCETQSIWDSTPLETPVLDIKPADPPRMPPRPKHQSTPADVLREKNQSNSSDAGHDSGVDVDASDEEEAFSDAHDEMDGPADVKTEGSLVHLPQSDPQPGALPIPTTPSRLPLPISPPASAATVQSFSTAIDPGEPLRSPSPVVASNQVSTTAVDLPDDIVFERPSGRHSSDSTSMISVASGEDSKKKPQALRSRPLGPRRRLSQKDHDTASSAISPTTSEAQPMTPLHSDDAASSLTSNSSEPPPLSTSTDSLASSSSATPSLGNGFNSVNHSLSAANSLNSSNFSPTAIQFPTKDNSGSPQTPLSSRRSFPTLSLPGLGGLKSDSSHSGTTPSSPFTRLKKTSISLLSKYSNSSASSPTGRPYISSPYSSSSEAALDSSVSSPSSTPTGYILDNQVDPRSHNGPSVVSHQGDANELDGLRKNPLQRQSSQSSFLSVDPEEDPDEWTRSVMADLALGDWKPS